MKMTWRTAWQGQDVVIYRDDEEVDRVASADIRRVVLVHRGSGESPGDLVRALVETDADCLLFPAHTGFGGRVNFERQAFWAERNCVYWVNEARAPLPLRLRRGSWLMPFGQPGFLRLPRTDLSAAVERWPIEGPQTWEQRKWRRIENKRPFAPAADTRLRA